MLSALSQNKNKQLSQVTEFMIMILESFMFTVSTLLLYSDKYSIVKPGNQFAKDHEFRALVFISFKLFNYFDPSALKL